MDSWVHWEDFASLRTIPLPERAVETRSARARAAEDLQSRIPLALLERD